MIFGNPELISLLGKVQLSFGLSTPTLELGLASLTPASEGLRKQIIEACVKNRDWLLAALSSPEMDRFGVGTALGGNDANFIVVPFLDPEHKTRDVARAKKVCIVLENDYDISVRYVGDSTYLEACVRITVGTESENEELVSCMGQILKTL